VGGLSITGSSSTFDSFGRPFSRCVCACSGPCVAWRGPVIDVVGAGATATQPPGRGFGCGIGCRWPPSRPPGKHAHRRLILSSSQTTSSHDYFLTAQKLHYGFVKLRFFSVLFRRPSALKRQGINTIERVYNIILSSLTSVTPMTTAS